MRTQLRTFSRVAWQSILVAGVGSCSAFTCAPSENPGGVTMIAGGIALTIGLLFGLVANSYRMKLFAVIGVASYSAGVWIFTTLIIPALAGGFIAGNIARRIPDSARITAWATGILCFCAIVVAAVGFTIGYFVSGPSSAGGFISNSSIIRDLEHPMRFAIIAGSVVPLIAAITAWLAGRK